MSMNQDVLLQIASDVGELRGEVKGLTVGFHAHSESERAFQAAIEERLRAIEKTHHQTQGARGFVQWGINLLIGVLGVVGALWWKS